MSRKTVAFGRPARPAASADEWVSEKAAKRLKRLSVDVPEPLHRRIKARCAERGEKMNDVLAAILDAAFPESVDAGNP